MAALAVQIVFELINQPDWHVTAIRTTTAAGTERTFSYVTKDWPDGAGIEVIAGIVGVLNCRGSRHIASVGGKDAPAAELELVRRMQNLWNDWRRTDPRLQWLKNVFDKREGEDPTKVKLDELFLVVNHRSGPSVTYARGEKDAKPMGRLLLNGQSMGGDIVGQFLKEAFDVELAERSPTPGSQARSDVPTSSAGPAPVGSPRRVSQATSMPPGPSDGWAATQPALQLASSDTGREQSSGGADGITRVRYRMSTGAYRLTCCAWGSGGNALYASGFEGTLYALTAEVPSASLRLDSAPVRTLLVDAEEGILLAGDDAGHITSVELGSGKKVVAAQCASTAFSIARSERPRQIVVATGSGAVDEWAVDREATGRRSGRAASHRLRSLYSHGGAAFTVRYDVDGRRYVSAGADGAVLWMQLDGGRVARQRVAEAALFGLSIRPVSGVIAAGDATGRIHLLGEHRVLVGHENMVRTLEFSPNGVWLFSGSKDRTVRLWHYESGRAWILDQVEDYVYEVTLSPDGQTLAVADGAGVVSCIRFPRVVDELTPREVSNLVE